MTIWPPQRPWYISRTFVLVLFWLPAFAATHTPPPARPSPMVLNDKLLHFVGYGVLGLLVVWRLAGYSARPATVRLLLWYVILGVYGLLDEATQEFVGRSFEWSDWLANLAGALAGMMIGAICMNRDARRAVSRPE